MERDKAQLEVCVVSRDEADQVEAEYWATVVRAYLVEGVPYLQVLEQINYATVQCDLSMENYLIRAVLLGEVDGSGPVHEPYSTSREDQNDAFETIKKLLEEEADFRKMEEEKEEKAGPTLIAGPKRLEILFQAWTLGHEQVRYVVTSFTGHTGHHKYCSVVGRKWEKHPSILAKTQSSVHSNTHSIKQIFVYAGGVTGAATVESIGVVKEEQDRGWKIVEREYLKMMQAELNVVKRWDVASGLGTDEEDEMFGEASYWNRTPYAYRPVPPPIAYFRVAGDEIGVTIHREQQKKMELVGKEEAPVNSTKAVATKTEEGGTTLTGDSFCDCRSPMCDICGWDFVDGRLIMGPTSPLVH
jgi:hypothetical protein